MIYLLAFLMNVTTGLLIIGNPLLAIARFNAGPLTLGILGTVGAGIYGLACAGSGFIVERIGFKKILILSCVFLLLIYPAIFAVSRLWHLFALVICGSLGVSLFWPAMLRWLGEETRGHALRRRIGSFNIGLIGGVMAGNVICGKIFELDDRYPYLVSAAIVLGILFLLFRGQIGAKQFLSAPPPAAGLEEGERHLAGFIYIGWLANFACWFAIGASEYLFPKLALDLNIGVQILGVLIGLIPLGEVIAFFFLRKTPRWHYNFPGLIFFQAMGIAGLFILLRTSSPGLFALGFLLIGACGGMTYFSSLFYSLHRQTAKERKSGYHESFLGLGVALGPIGGGLAARSWGLRAPYLLCIAIFIFSVLAQAIIRQRSKKNVPGSNPEF